MTTSAARTRTDFGRGFTLIEIVVVMAIMGIVMAGAVAYIAFPGGERQLRDTSSEIENLAKRARSAAILQQIPYAIEFRPGAARLMPLAEAGRSEAKTALGQTVGGETVIAPGSSTTHSEVALDGEITPFIRRWGTDQWLEMNDRYPHVWRFDPDGLSEPISVRLTKGDNFIETTYHPLTATVRDTEFSFK